MSVSETTQGFGMSILRWGCDFDCTGSARKGYLRDFACFHSIAFYKDIYYCRLLLVSTPVELETVICVLQV